MRFPTGGHDSHVMFPFGSASWGLDLQLLDISVLRPINYDLPSLACLFLRENKYVCNKRNIFENS